MPKFTAELVMKKLQENKIDLAGAKVAVLGLAYKGGIDDDRESPSYKVIEHLQSYGLVVSFFDPYVQKEGSAKDLDEALAGTVAVVIATAHPQFKSLSPDDLVNKGVKFIIDGRNCLDKEQMESVGLNYQGIGR